ncbi:MAG: hypothetical protein OIN85_02745 [Candidatus Methanoperedens sp.]|nr:hypothetical protein [Candidatus Methanoperedens sp.]
MGGETELDGGWDYDAPRIYISNSINFLAPFQYDKLVGIQKKNRRLTCG